MKKILTSIALIILTVSQISCSSINKKTISLPPLSVQLWSVKDQIKIDYKGTLQKLSAMGFSGVEFANEFGPFKNKPEALKQYLSTLNLQASGAHVSFEALNDENFQKTVSFYQKLGVDSLIIGWDKRSWHPEGVIEVVSLLNKLAIKLAPYNMKTGFHNHDHEFNSFNNTTYWDYIAQNTSQNVILQLDAGWVVYAGKDPVEYVKRYPGRTLTTHYKARIPEAMKSDHNKLPIIGQDTADWLSLLKANSTIGGTKWIVVEQEEYPNGLSSLEAVALSKKGLDIYIKNL